jgi:hypothetical protein
MSRYDDTRLQTMPQPCPRLLRKIALRAGSLHRDHARGVVSRPQGRRTSSLRGRLRRLVQPLDRGRLVHAGCRDSRRSPSASTAPAIIMWRTDRSHLRLMAASIAPMVAATPTTVTSRFAPPVGFICSLQVPLMSWMVERGPPRNSFETRRRAERVGIDSCHSDR